MPTSSTAARHGRWPPTSTLTGWLITGPCPGPASRHGHAVHAEPYLGARGHLVALREGDLAYLHVHPSGNSVAFATGFPTAGRYRLYLQFKHDGRVHTAAFTCEVAR